MVTAGAIVGAGVRIGPNATRRADFGDGSAGFSIVDPEADTWYGLYGQSLALGTGGAPALNTTATYPGEVLEVAAGGASLQDLVEASVETASFMLGTESRTLRGSGIFGVASGGAGGTAIAGLSSGTAPYIAFIAEIQDAYNLTIAAGRTFRLRAVCFMHGESDELQGNGSYGTSLLALQASLEADIQAIQGTSETIPLILYQLSTYDSTIGGSNVCLQQLETARANPQRIVIAGPQYTEPYSADRLHMINTSYEDWGQRFAACAHQLFFSNGSWSTHGPSRIEADGSTVTVTLDAPTLPLQFDNVSLAIKASQGFEVYSPTAQEVSISSVSLLSQNQISLTLNEAPGPEVLIGYGLAGASGNAGGLAGNPTTLQTDAPGGNLVDSSTDPFGCVHFQDAIDSGALARPASVSTHHFSMTDGNEGFTVANDASLQVSSDFTLLFYLRVDTPVNNRILLEHGNTSTQGWSVRTWYSAGIGHELVFYFSGATAGNVRTSNDLLGLTNSWMAVCMTKSGTTVRVWSTTNEVWEATLVAGGTMPGTLTAPTVAWGCGHANFAPSCDIGFVAQWLSAATPSQVYELMRNPVDLSGVGMGRPVLLFDFDGADLPGSGSIANDGTGGSTLNGTGNANALDTDIVAGGPSL